MNRTSTFRAIAAIAFFGIPTAHAKAAIVALYDPADNAYDGSAAFAQTYYTLFETFHDEQLVGLAVNYDPGPGNDNPGFRWSVWESNANGLLGTEVLQIADYNPSLGSPDPGFGTYETAVNLGLESGHYYVVAFQAANDPNSIRYDYPTQPFVTPDGNFKVVSGGASALINVNDPVFAAAQFSLDVAPEPSTIALFGGGLAILLALSMANRGFANARAI